ncbi:glycogen debranching protein GlgX [soil metagenome]
MRLGLHFSGSGVEAAVMAPRAEMVDVCLFDNDDQSHHGLVRGSDGIHRGFLDGIEAGRQYGLRAHGTWDPRRGKRHHPSRLLLDPHARAVTGGFEDHPALHDDDPPPAHGEDTAPFAPRGVVVRDPTPPRGGPRVPWEDMVVYEAHVRGLTMRHPDVEPSLRGTFLGVASAPVIDHLQRLGVTTVELMPVAHHVSEPFLQRCGRTNYWGYSTIAWFAPHGGYGTADDGRQVAEFAEMVDRLHAAGLEVIVDVVFNHTAEGGAEGPVLSMKGLDNAGWYRLEPEDPSRYVDWTGTGNTVDAGSERVRGVIVEALRWWAEGLGVDGFRFDLATTLGRGPDGSFHPDNLAWLSEDPVVGGRKLIAEPWDLGPDGYRLGGFPRGWAEWNGRYRDDIRDIWRGGGSTGHLAAAMSGTRDVFTPGSSGPVNYVTSHDGFTLADLVSYDHKHNNANGENNGDGHDDNRSWNSGHEGPTDDPQVLEVRRRRAGAMLATLLLSVGVPMVLGGDELGRTQRGNNNAYSIDGPDSWLDWSGVGPAGVIEQTLRMRQAFLSEAPAWRTMDGAEVASWEEPGPLVAVHSESGALLVALNPTGSDVDATLPDGPWDVILDSGGAVGEGPFSGSVPIPAWTVLGLMAARGNGSHPRPAADR